MVRGALGRDAEWTERTERRLAEASPKPAPPPADEDGIVDWDFEDPPIPWIIGGLIQEATVTVAFADPNALKTWTCYSMATAVAKGELWLGRAVSQGLVIIVDYESSLRQVRRRMRVLKQAGLSRQVRYFRGTGMPLDGAEIWDRITRLRPRLVIVDSLQRGMPGLDLNDAKIAQAPMSYAAAVASDHGTATIMIHHKVKGKDGHEASRGSGAIMAAAENWLEFLDVESLPGGAQRTTLHCGRLKEGTSFDDIRLELSDEKGLIEIADKPSVSDAEDVDKSKAKLLLTLATSGGRVPEAELLRKSGLRSGNRFGGLVAKQALRELVESGQVYKTKTDNGRGWLYCTQLV
jgi:hypothetical protein